MIRGPVRRFTEVSAYNSSTQRPPPRHHSGSQCSHTPHTRVTALEFGGVGSGAPPRAAVPHRQSGLGPCARAGSPLPAGPFRDESAQPVRPGRPSSSSCAAGAYIVRVPAPPIATGSADSDSVPVPAVRASDWQQVTVIGKLESRAGSPGASLSRSRRPASLNRPAAADPAGAEGDCGTGVIAPDQAQPAASRREGVLHRPHLES